MASSATGATGAPSALPWEREPAPWSSSGATGATGAAGTAEIASVPKAFARLGDGLHSHDEFSVTLPAHSVRAAEVHQATLTTPKWTCSCF